VSKVATSAVCGMSNVRSDPTPPQRPHLHAPHTPHKELGCMTLKQGPNCGYWAQNGVIIGLYGPKTGLKLGLLAQNAVKP
jgi:hypothetical protein